LGSSHDPQIATELLPVILYKLISVFHFSCAKRRSIQVTAAKGFAAKDTDCILTTALAAGPVIQRSIGAAGGTMNLPTNLTH
ncbi:hypothetical protein AAK917_07710, partial [Oscillospiraceae bacterium 52-8]